MISPDFIIYVPTGGFCFYIVFAVREIRRLRFNRMLRELQRKIALLEEARNE